MRYLAILCALIVILLLPKTVAADDGDVAVARKMTAGWITEVFYLCDSVVEADDPDTCTPFDLDAHHGNPDEVTIEIAEDDGCSAAFSVNVDTYEVSGNDVHDVATLNATTTRLVAEGADFDRYIAVDSATLTGCTDLDIIIILRWRMRRELLGLQ